MSFVLFVSPNGTDRCWLKPKHRRQVVSKWAEAAVAESGVAVLAGADAPRGGFPMGTVWAKIPRGCHALSTCIDNVLFSMAVAIEDADRNSARTNRRCVKLGGCEGLDDSVLWVQIFRQRESEWGSQVIEILNPFKLRRDEVVSLVASLIDEVESKEGYR